MSEDGGVTLAPPRLVALTPQRHGTLRLDMSGRFGSAAKLTAVPLMLAELGEASAHYPIGFLSAPIMQLVAVLGVRNGENLFVNDDGSWAAGVYIPALLRRQPFSLGRTASPTDFAVVIDEAHEALSTTRGQPLFDDERPTPLMCELRDLCREIGSTAEATAAFASAVAAEGLLDERFVGFNLPGGGQSTVQGLLAVQPDRLARLHDETVVGWFRKGFLPAIYYHLASAGRWSDLLRRVQVNG